jgi:hypothetical protein
MSNTHKISILLPTRGRCDSLKISVQSLFEKAAETRSIQIMFGFDRDDDVGTQSFKVDIEPYLKDKNVSYCAFLFEPLGYIRLNEYVNYMALKSQADWLVFWNDDAVMETDNWDQIIVGHTGEFKLLAFHSHNEHPYSIFPIVPKSWLDLLGYLSPHQLSDAWLSQQAYMLDIWERISVQVTHDRYDLTGNNHDDTYKNRPMLEGNPSDPRDFNSTAMRQLRFDDCGKLAQYMKQHGIDTTFFENIMAGKQNPWEKLIKNDINQQMKQFTVPK